MVDGCAGEDDGTKGERTGKGGRERGKERESRRDYSYSSRVEDLLV